MVERKLPIHDSHELRKLSFKGEVYGVKMLEITKQKALGTCEDDSGTACKKLL